MHLQGLEKNRFKYLVNKVRKRSRSSVHVTPLANTSHKELLDIVIM